MKIIERKIRTVSFLKLKPGTVFKIPTHNSVFLKCLTAEKAVDLENGVIVSLSDVQTIPLLGAAVVIGEEM